jgi:hypothetical protein
MGGDDGIYPINKIKKTTDFIFISLLIYLCIKRIFKHLAVCVHVGQLCGGVGFEGGIQ